jgi:glycosyltransferase involved in cell wall biosynthesis
LIIGRGTHRREVAEEPARELGIADRVVFAGYRVDDYIDVVRAIDVFTFLVPGSDGTCRALLEALSLGTPAVTTRRGALPEIIRDGETGYTVDEEPDLLADRWHELLSDESRRKAFGEAARRDAVSRFAIPRFADEVASFYEDVEAFRRG